MANDLVPLDTLAKEINACDDKASHYARDAEDFRATRDAKIREAYTRIVRNREIETGWADWCEANVKVARQQVTKITASLRAPAKARQQSGHADVQTETVHSVGEWTAPKGLYAEPPEPVEIADRPHVKEIIAGLFDLADDERAFIMEWIEKQGWLWRAA